MGRTFIEWAQNPDGTPGFTLNIFTGCLKRCSYCYAWQESLGRCRQADLAGTPAPGKGYDPEDPFWPRYHPERLAGLGRKKPAGIFLNNRSDMFADYWPRKWVRAQLEAIKKAPQHRIYLLTHQPQELPQWSPFPDHCWVGATATDEISAWSASFWFGMKGEVSIKAKVKLLSIEPLLKSIDGSYDFPLMSKEAYLEAILRVFDLVIIGAQTKPFKPPEVEWVREIVEACDRLRIPVFLKDNLGWPKLSVDGAMPFYKRHPSGTMELRQELPGGGDHARRE